MNILIADDNENLRRVISLELTEEGYAVAAASDGIAAYELLEKNDFDVLLLDLNMPLLGGMEILKKIKALHIPVEVIVLTGHGTVSVAVEAMKLGAYDFLTKPFEMSQLKAVVEKAGEKKRIVSENLMLKSQLRRQAENKKIISRSPLMLEILESVKKIALTDFPVLIMGESGTGKELIALAVHDSSQRYDGPFIPINCGAIPENMIESELFGHEKGAFTGALVRKPGLLELASNGTLFLDEIGELDQGLQTRLLRVLETGRFFRVGGTREVQVNVRYVAATNRDIKAGVDKGNFRADLYYRISALTLHIPPLRQRQGDVPLLVEYFLKNNPAFRNKQFSGDALQILQHYAWPGNVRELQNIVHRAALLSRDELIAASDLPSDLVPAPPLPAHMKLEEIEKNHILAVIREAGGQKGKAAELLGIDPKTLYRKLRAYRISE
ncbi:MAG: sigma-54-dependent Fis family transcriptional regulator [Nitrospirae bacterium]|nr:MAG: sigma-54-dependent Fis family transcriptional regulator [Nitrospirota bacterium]